MSKILKNYSELPKRLIPFFVTLVLVVGCQGEYRTDLDYTHRIQQTWEIKEIEDAFLTQFEQVVFEPDDTISLREQISEALIKAGTVSSRRIFFTLLEIILENLRTVA